MTGGPTQTRRDVRSESISATCIVESEIFDGVVVEVVRLSVGGTLTPELLACRRPTSSHLMASTTPQHTRGGETAFHTEGCTAALVDTRSINGLYQSQCAQGHLHREELCVRFAPAAHSPRSTLMGTQRPCQGIEQCPAQAAVLLLEAAIFDTTAKQRALPPTKRHQAAL